MKSFLLLALYSLGLFLVTYLLLDVEGMFLNALARQSQLEITHQPSLAARADRILLLHDGKIAFSGSHSEILNQENAYSNGFKQILHLTN